MKKMLLFVLVAFLASCQSQRVEKNSSLRVLTFNILGGRNTDNKHDLQRIADVINELKPDIVAMQEVDKNTGRIKNRDITREIAELTGMFYVFGKAMDFDGGEYGEAVLSKYKILKSENFTLPAEKGAEPRALLAVTVAFPGSEKPYVFYATHLDHLKKSKNRLMQVVAINKILAAQELPYLLAGDLNARPGSATMKALEKTCDLHEKKFANQATFFSKIPFKIDWIASDKSGRWSLAEAWTGDKQKNPPAGWQQLLRLASDHLPLMAVYEFEEQD